MRRAQRAEAFEGSTPSTPTHHSDLKVQPWGYPAASDLAACRYATKYTLDTQARRERSIPAPV